MKNDTLGIVGNTKNFLSGLFSSRKMNQDNEIVNDEISVQNENKYDITPLQYENCNQEYDSNEHKYSQQVEFQSPFQNDYSTFPNNRPHYHGRVSNISPKPRSQEKSNQRKVPSNGFDNYYDDTGRLETVEKEEYIPKRKRRPSTNTGSIPKTNPFI